MKLHLNRHASEKKATRDGFGDGLLIAGRANKKIVALTADLAESTRVHHFAQEFPDRFVECGICEQHMMSAAAGMAHVGKVPFVASFAAFNPGRNYDQLRVSVCYSNHNVKIFGGHAGLTVGEDGATHQMMEDIAMARATPNLTVLVPCDYEEARKATMMAARIEGPVYIRGGRLKVPMLTSADTPFAIGKAEVFMEGTDVAIIACGIMTHEALRAAEILRKEGVHPLVLNSPSIKPLDEHGIVQVAKETGCVVTAEEHQVNGGLGGAVAEVLGKKYPVPIECVGMQDSFGESGDADELLDKYGLRAENIVRAVKKVMKRK